MSYESFSKAVTLARMAETCNSLEMKDAQAAFDGDEDAAFSLSISLSNGMCGAVAVAMWRAKVKREAFRRFFSSVWSHEHRSVIAAAQTRRTLSYMFRYAAFPLPTDMPDTVTVWRGSSYLPFNDAKKGYSWSTDRDLACWFAMRFADFNGSPIVLTADIAKGDIALFDNERNESEAVLMRPPAARVDGDVNDWTACFLRTQDGMHRTLKELITKPHKPDSFSLASD